MEIKRLNGKAAILELSSSSVKLLIGSITGNKFTTNKSVRTETTKGLVNGKMDLSWYKKNVLPVIVDFKNECDSSKVTNIKCICTAVYRKSSNCDDIFDLIENSIGIRPILLSGSEEAELSPIAFINTNKHVKGWLLFVDQGRGSTEFTLLNTEINRAPDMYSFPFGNDNIRKLGINAVLSYFSKDNKVQNILKKASKVGASVVSSGGILTKNQDRMYKEGQFIKKDEFDSDILQLYRTSIESVGQEGTYINEGGSTVGAFIKYFKK